MRKWTAILLSLLLAVFLVSCSRTGRTAARPGASAAPPAPAGPAGVPGAQPPGASPAAPAPGSDARKTITLTSEQPPVTPAAVRKETGISTLLSQGVDRRTLPEDFRIGELGDGRTGDADDQQAMKTAGAFLGQLVAGKVASSYLAPDARTRVADLFSFGLQSGDVPKSWRLGAPHKRESGELTAPVRIFGSVGTSEGEVTLVRSGRQWLISDFQISLAALLEKQEKPKERFFPSSYRWMLEE